MKNIFILTLAALSLGFGKPASADYKMSFSSYHHGQMQSNIWRLNQNKLEVVYYEWGAKEQIIVYSTTVKPETLIDFQSLDFNGLEDNYDNRCVVLTSGDEYFVSIGYGNEAKNIHFHHYYKEEVAQLVAKINSLLPEEHHINYVGADTHQDCK